MNSKIALVSNYIVEVRKVNDYIVLCV